MARAKKRQQKYTDHDDNTSRVVGLTLALTGRCTDASNRGLSRPDHLVPQGPLLQLVLALHQLLFRSNVIALLHHIVTPMRPSRVGLALDLQFAPRVVRKV